MYNEEEKTFTLDDGLVLRNIHTRESCKGEFCTIHKPKESPMNSWPIIWRVDRRIFERVCKHGVGHPDPSGYYPNEYDRIHGCCGCCKD